MTIGLAGIGRMGAAMAERLIDEGERVIVWNRSPGRTADLVARGAVEAGTPAALVGMADPVITCLTNADALEAVYGALLAGPVEGKLFIEMSTVRPEVQVALAERVRAAGARIIECPVGGTVGPARSGKLFGFAGGDADDVARASSVLDILCRRVEHVGGHGAGAKLKLAINLPLAVYWQSLGEAMSLCRDLRIEGARLADIFGDTSGGANVMKVRGPALGEALDGAELPGTFDLDGFRKDLGSMLAEGESLGLEMPVTRAAAGAYDEAIAAGLGAMDGPQQTAFWRARGR